MKREAEELIDQYLQEVGRHLPQRQRSDVTAELRSLIADSARDRQAEEPSLSDREAVLAAVRALGEPASMARRYAAAGGELISPALYPTFQQLLKILPAAIAGALTVAWFVQAVITGRTSLSSIATLIGNIAVWVPWNIGLMVLIFLAMDRLSALRARRAQWTPAEMRSTSGRDEAKTVELMFRVYLLAALIFFVLAYPEWIGFYIPAKPQGGRFIPLKDLGFIVPVLPFAIVWAGHIAVCAVVLRERRWRQLTHAANGALSLASSALLAFMLIYSDPVSSIFARIVQWTVVFAIVGTLIDALKAFWRAFASGEDLTEAQSSPGPAR